MSYNIAIDGPAGAGKSTIAKSVAKQLNFVYVDTGAMYRAMGLYVIRNHREEAKKEEIIELCKEVRISISYIDGEQQVLLNGENVNRFIRDEKVGKMASMCAKYQEIRDLLLDLQKDLASQTDVIMDGRDIGTQVLPNADLKIFLTASVEERANRRWLELKEKGISFDKEKIMTDIKERDEQDMNREISPLKQAEDAIVIDSSFMSIKEVIEHIINLYKNTIK